MTRRFFYRPMRRRTFRKAARSAVAAITLFSFLAPWVAQAQDLSAPTAAPAESTAPVQTAPAEAAPVPSAPVEQPPAANAAPESPAAVSAPDARPAQTSPPAPVAQPTPSSPATANETLIQAPSAAETPAPATPASTEQTPPPSLLENPAAVISNALNSQQRDSGLPHDLSPWGMFMAADRIVKAVMIGLALASFGVWTVLVAKVIEIACARARAKRAVAVIGSAATLTDASQQLSGRGGPGAFMVRSAEDELRRSEVALNHAGNEGVKERLGARLARIEAQAARRLSRGTGLLATVGSTAPFVGLFGTVWGIMNSFIGISQSNTTNLAVVAPGIAEALLATAIGLVAAIPAVIMYNIFARLIASYAQLLADAASGVEQLVSLDLDLRKVPPGYRNDTGLSGASAFMAAE